MSPLAAALIMCGVAFLIGMLFVKLWFELTNGLVQRLKDFTAGDRGRLTQRKADYLNETEARRIFGDAEVDRFIQYGDYDPPSNYNER